MIAGIACFLCLAGGIAIGMVWRFDRDSRIIDELEENLRLSRGLVGGKQARIEQLERERV